MYSFHPETQLINRLEDFNKKKQKIKKQLGTNVSYYKYVWPCKFEVDCLGI